MSRDVAIVVPGICGSNLAYASGPKAGKPVWFNVQELFFQSVGALQLAPNGVDPGPLASGPLTPSGPVDMGVYEPMIAALKSAGFVTDFYAYDWRHDLNATAAALASYLHKYQSGDNLHFACHSMGGLVAQLAYPLYRAGGQPSTWVRTVYMGTPQGGSVWGSLLTAGYRSNQYMATVLANTIGLATIGVQLGNTVQGILLRNWCQTVASWPSAYQLMPSNVGPWSGLDPNAAQFLVQANYAADNPYTSAAWFALASATHSTLAAGLSGPRPPEVNVIGIGQPTLNLLTSVSNIGQQSGYNTTVAGDNTVTQVRGVLPGKSTKTMTGTHQAYCQNGSFLADLPDLLRNGLGGDSTIPAAPPAVAAPQAVVVPGVFDPHKAPPVQFAFDP